MDLVLPLTFLLAQKQRRLRNQRRTVRRRRRARAFKTRINLHNFTDEETCHIFRLSKTLILEVYEQIKTKICSVTRRSHAIPGITKLLCVLHYLASGSFQYCAAAKMGVSQPSFSRFFPTVIDAIVGLAPKYISFPTSNTDLEANKLAFYQKTGFPNVVGLIDCTHVCIVAPSEGEHSYRNRKHYHSLNIQVVCGPQMEIIDVVAMYPGCTHDAYILANSCLGAKFEEGAYGDSFLLGDNGYRLTPWLMTPFLNPTTRAQKKFNQKHRQTRSLIERLFGILKSRFRCLDFTGGAILYNPHLVCRIIVACCILQNLANKHNLQVDLCDDLRQHIDYQGDYGIIGNNAGQLRRQQITDAYFTD